MFRDMKMRFEKPDNSDFDRHGIASCQRHKDEQSSVCEEEPPRLLLCPHLSGLFARVSQLTDKRGNNAKPLEMKLYQLQGF